MSEEAIADSEEGGIDMEAAIDEITESLFDKPEEVEEVIEEVEEEPKKEIAAKEEKEEKEPEVKLNDLPQSWKKEMQEKWEGVDPDTQRYFIEREAQMAKGDELRQQDAVYGRTMRDVMAPHEELFKQQNMDQVEFIGRMTNAHVRLSTASDQEKIEIFNNLAKTYGVPINSEAPQASDEVKALQDRFSNIESQLNASQQRADKQRNEKVATDIEAFASDPEHALFDEVSEQIVLFINAGQDLETAYQSAIWQNPVTRQKEIDRMNKEASEKSLETAKQETEKARKAKSTNLKGRDTKTTPTEPKGKMFDDMHDIYRDFQNQ